MVHTRDEFIVDLNGQIDQLEGQVQTLETTVGEHEAMIKFLEEQMQDLNMEIDHANEQLQLQQVQQDALHAPPDVMDVDGEEEPEEIEGYSYVDFEEADPQPAQMGAHSPVSSVASVNNLDDF
jgi:chromosome segregation ATPase